MSIKISDTNTEQGSRTKDSRIETVSQNTPRACESDQSHELPCFSVSLANLPFPYALQSVCRRLNDNEVDGDVTGPPDSTSPRIGISTSVLRGPLPKLRLALRKLDKCRGERR